MSLIIFSLTFAKDTFMIILLLIFWYEDFFHPQQSEKMNHIKHNLKYLYKNGLQSNKKYQSNLYKIQCYIWKKHNINNCVFKKNIVSKCTGPMLLQCTLYLKKYKTAKNNIQISQSIIILKVVYLPQ